jgi:aspartyl-tRNA(Asn)/glutamyl-tRNA(Gln) amidotransferase subunit A
VARLRAHGAILLGKTTTPEFGWKGVTDSALMGVTRNPWNPDVTPGGSSGGAAVAAALGMGTLHQGTDGGGSIRIPAGFSGVFGIKPTFGRVPAWPASPFGTVSHLGPLTRSVADGALMMTVMAEPDPRDWYALPAPTQDWRIGLEGGVAGLRIAYSPRLGHIKVDPEIARLVARAVADLSDLGAIVEEADPDLGDAAEVFRIHWFTGAANLARKMTAKTLAAIDPGLREIAAVGAGFTLAEYMEAVAAREAMGLAMNRFHERYDLLATPTLPIPAFKAGVEVPPRSGMTRWTDWTPFTYPFNLTRQPAATVPCGLTRAGLPAGLQLVGPLHREDLVLRACRAYESVRPIALPKMATEKTGAARKKKG